MWMPSRDCGAPLLDISVLAVQTRRCIASLSSAILGHSEPHGLPHGFGGGLNTVEGAAIAKADWAVQRPREQR